MCVGALFLPRPRLARSASRRRHRRSRDPHIAARCIEAVSRVCDALKFRDRAADDGEGGIVPEKKVPVRRPFGVSVLSGNARNPTVLRKRREDRREASSNAPCAPENQWGGDVHIMAAKKKTAKKTAKSKKK